MNERVIFDAALEIADPQARRAFIEKACAGHPEMLAAVESLLKSHDSAGSFLDIPAAQQMQNASPLNPADSAAAVEKTRMYQPGDADDDDTDDSRPDLSFLQPSNKPGSIGVLGHYEVLSLLGQGAFGIVFKAFDEKLHRLVAIKIMNPQMASTSPPRKRFLREARSAAAIKHENVVQVYSVEEQPLPYLVMEFIDGQTLKQKLDGCGPLETPEVLHIARQIASGLAAAQAMGLIHRDIKPANILLELGAEQRVKISDFGLARAADDASMTRTGVISGTPMYMAPEQAAGQSLDHRADLFSFGSVLYQMACGRPPFRAANTIAVLRRVVEDTPRPLQEILPEIPDWLVAIVTKLLAKKPEDRFQTAKEVADLLARCQSELQLNGQVTCVAPTVGHVSNVPAPNPVKPIPTTTVSITKPVEPSPSSEHVENVLHEKRRRPFLIAATLIAFAAIVGLIINHRQNDTRKMAAPGRLSDPLSHTKKTAEGGHPTKASGWHGWPADAPPPAIAPFDAEQAKHHQEAWAKYLGVPVEYTNSLGMKFRLIPPGEFLMGLAREDLALALRDVHPDDASTPKLIKSEEPQHRVVLTKPFFLGATEVTQDKYATIANSSPSFFSAESSFEAGRKAVEGEQTANFPVERVSWVDASLFCDALSRRDNLLPEGSPSYRLPTEAEWEFATGAGAASAWWWRNENESARNAWCINNSGGRTHKVATLNSNPFGLFDTLGNVWEWCSDPWSDTYFSEFADRIARDPTGPAGNTELRTLKGGYYGYAATLGRCSSRTPQEKVFSYESIGFRIALPVDAVRQALKLTGPAMPKRPKASVTDASTSSTAKPLTPLPPLDLDEIDPLPGWELPAGAPPPVVAPCEPTLATERQQLWAEFLKRPVIEELDVA
ncbi:MAG: bifunctional serine/threonine-protein kinase/formylglycine-generating enzyme family protein, partial [Planctomycetia bacterium]|nr:bifunctional serine/threonine-protein kinase/formylglycine-generating enzyme family protein [Planctomycetia bacterium]